MKYKKFNRSETLNIAIVGAMIVMSLFVKAVAIPTAIAGALLLKKRWVDRLFIGVLIFMVLITLHILI